MEKSTPKERKTRAKAAAPVQPENSDTPAENAAEQQPACGKPAGRKKTEQNSPERKSPERKSA